MSIYLMYFEKSQFPIDGDFSGFKDVNKYIYPESWVCEKITLIHKDREIDASIFFDGMSSDFFYSFDKSYKGIKGEECRKILFDFILTRLKNNCIQAFLYIDILDGDFSGIVRLPDKFKTINSRELEDIFRSKVFNGFFLVNDVMLS